LETPSSGIGNVVLATSINSSRMHERIAHHRAAVSNLGHELSGNTRAVLEQQHQ
jgi:hypothetical protein